ncbi:MAG: class II glutamine amidotransferase [Vulcanisaeta sp.]
MCRVFVFSSNGSASELVINGLSALRNSAQADPMGPSGVINHSDGWGFTVVSYGVSTALKWHYRSLTPIYKDDNYQSLRMAIGRLLMSGESYGIFHVLNAADKKLIRIENVHPSMVYTRDGELHVVHNGVVNKYALFEILRREYGVELNVDDASDTYVLTHLIASMYNEVGNLESTIKELAGLLREINGVESALNTGILLIKPCCAELFITTMYNSDVINNERRRRYYNLFIGRLNNGVFAASSTLVRVYGLAKLGDTRELEPGMGELIYCRLSTSDFNCSKA